MASGDKRDSHEMHLSVKEVSNGSSGAVGRILHDAYLRWEDSDQEVYVYFQGVPDSGLNYNRSSVYNDVDIPGRNEKVKVWTGGGDKKINLALMFAAVGVKANMPNNLFDGSSKTLGYSIFDKNSYGDIIKNLRALEALTYGRKNGLPPPKIELRFGQFFTCRRSLPCIVDSVNVTVDKNYPLDPRSYIPKVVIAEIDLTVSHDLDQIPDYEAIYQDTVDAQKVFGDRALQQIAVLERTYIDEEDLPRVRTAITGAKQLRGRVNQIKGLEIKAIKRDIKGRLLELIKGRFPAIGKAQKWLGAADGLRKMTKADMLKFASNAVMKKIGDKFKKKNRGNLVATGAAIAGKPGLTFGDFSAVSPVGLLKPGAGGVASSVPIVINQTKAPVSLSKVQNPGTIFGNWRTVLNGLISSPPPQRIQPAAAGNPPSLTPVPKA